MHITSWRHPLASPNASIDVHALAQQAQIAEAGKFDFVFSADSLAINHESHPQIVNRFDPIVLSTALAGRSEERRVGKGCRWRVGRVEYGEMNGIGGAVGGREDWVVRSDIVLSVV